MLVQQSMTYHQLFDEFTESLKKVKTTTRMEELWSVLGPYLLKAMTESGCKSTFQKDLQGFFDRLVFASVKEEGPYCSKRVNQYFLCFDCEVKSQQNSSCYCVSCFVFDKHKGHNFRLLKSKLAVCDCGDPDALKKSSFCQKHKQVRKEPELDSQRVEQFIKEMQFLLYILFRLSLIKQDITDQQKKKELFARAYIKKLAKTIEKSYYNKIMVARFFFSTLLPFTSFDQVQTPMRRIIAFKKPTYFDKLSEDVLLPLYTVKEMRQMLLQQYFSLVHSKYNFMLPFSSLSKSMFQYTNAEKEVMNAIAKFGPMVIQFKFEKFMIKYHLYIEIFKTYLILLDKSFSLQVAILLMENLDISKLGQYYSHKLQKINNNQFYSLELSCFQVVLQLVKVIGSADKKEILLKMVKDSFKRIKVKKASPSFAVERMFALALFSFVDYDIQNILDMDEALMYEIFDETEQERLVNILQQAIKKAFTPLKLDNHTDLKQKVYRALVKKPYIIYSVDQAYLKILTYFLMRIQQHTYSYLLKPLEGFIQSKVKSIEILFNLYMTQQIMKLQDVIQNFFFEMQIIMRNLISISQTSLCEIITTLFLKPQKIKKNDIFDFFQFLVYVYDPPSVKHLRQIAKRYTENDKIIEQFVRNTYNRYKTQSSKGILPKNNFNISYNSYFLPFQTFKEYATIYELKIRKYTRTELSRFIFSYAMLDKIYQSFEYVMEKISNIGLHQYMTGFKQMMGSVVQLCILLALETKNQKFDELALRCISECKKAQSTKANPYENIQNEDYDKNLFKMYEDTRHKLQQQKRQKIPTKDINEKLDKNLRERAALKMKKINQLKQRQRSILASNSGSVQLPQEGKESSHICTICKDSTNKSELYYLCHTRFSNFIKSTKTKVKRTNRQIEDPILVISSCGHEVHLKCLKQSLRINGQIIDEQFEFQCFLCKTYSNSIFPIYSSQAIQQREKQKYLTKLANFVLFLMQDGYFTSKNIDYDRFNIQQILLNSITQQIYWYGTQLPKYFIMKLLPVIRQQLHLILPTHSTQYESKLKCEISQLIKKLKGLNEIDEETWLMWVKLGILLTITQPNINQEEGHAVKIQKLIKVPQAYEGEFEKMLLIMKELSTNKPMNSYDLITKFQIKDKQGIFFDLPQDLAKLNEQIGKCPSCTKVTSKMLICFTCGYKVCQSCTALINKHVSKHLGCCIFIRVEIGDCHVYWEQSRTESKSLYIDYAGEPLDDRSKFPQRQTFLLSKEFYNQLSTLLIGDMIPNDLQFHRHGICQVQ